ncbi:hypothetical protein [Polyangium sp. 15x6]|uniref:hypothetical protein n=1 Tax=Polyangium sp. 15x6 TaxID=3042687 RepID=UPI00249BD042|nr:hypothetical protein [Polyangium sp. 15x6]MDI3292181.1 hypothetical protein [Polyangium sp. 15x6]
MLSETTTHGNPKDLVTGAMLKLAEEAIADAVGMRIAAGARALIAERNGIPEGKIATYYNNALSTGSNKGGGGYGYIPRGIVQFPTLPGTNNTHMFARSALTPSAGAAVDVIMPKLRRFIR